MRTVEGLRMREMKIGEEECMMTKTKIRNDERIIDDKTMGGAVVSESTTGPPLTDF